MNYLLYIPGFNSSLELSQSFKVLQKEFGQDYEVICLKYDNLDPETAENQLSFEIDKYNTVENTVVLIAQSLGGYWGNQMSVKHNLPVVLINPSMTPNISLLKHTHHLQLRQHFPPIVIGDQPKLVLLSEDDEIVDPQYALSMYKDNSQTFIIRKATHRLTLNDWVAIMIHIKTFMSHILA